MSDRFYLVYWTGDDDRDKPSGCTSTGTLAAANAWCDGFETAGEGRRALVSGSCHWDRELGVPSYPGFGNAIRDAADALVASAKREGGPYTQAPALISRKDLDTLIRMREGSTVAEIATSLQRPEDKIRSLLLLLDREGAEFVLGMNA